MQVLDFAYQKFQLEVENENQLWKLHDEKRAQIGQEIAVGSQDGKGAAGRDDFDDADGFGGGDLFMYEKKLNILHIAHIIFWKTINEKSVKLEDITLHG